MFTKRKADSQSSTRKKFHFTLMQKRILMIKKQQALLNAYFQIRVKKTTNHFKG